MDKLFKQYLFTKRYFVATQNTQKDTFEVLFSLANLFGIKITSGAELADIEHVQLASEQLGRFVPDPFYKNFPQSVLKLTSDQLLFDQLVHYAVTYGFGFWGQAGHSQFEEDFERCAFKENVEIKEFEILSVEQAEIVLQQSVENMLASSRPLSKFNFDVVSKYIQTYDFTVTNCSSKNTLIKLLLETRKLDLVKLLKLSDVIKVVELLDYQDYDNPNVKKLSLTNQDRKFITRVLDNIFAHGKVNVLECYERKQLWCGLLHHIHYKGKNDVARSFVNAMRAKGNKSVYSTFELLISQGNVKEAVAFLKSTKGNNALMRNLNYVLSRCKTAEETDFVIKNLDANNVLVLLQLLVSYTNYKADNLPRTFKFTRFNKLVVHEETAKELARRKSQISAEQAQTVAKCIKKLLQAKLQNKLGNVYISPEMYNVGLPMQEGTSSGGFGVLPKGTKIHLNLSKKIRAFTYWEKVNDIDLSVLGFTDEGHQYEFSWRTMYGKQSEGITYSGDQTSGYNGGSEYFDVNVPKFKKFFPNVRYLVFCNNVFSGVDFSQVVCRAGYMLRDVRDSGQVFEPKTVQTSFKIDAQGVFACLFGVDLVEQTFVWLNLALENRSIVAGSQNNRFLLDYFNLTDVVNLGSFFEMMATNVVTDPQQADVIVSDENLENTQDKIVIHSYDFDKVTPYFE